MKAVVAASLLALGLATSAVRADEYPFLGTWDCEVAIFTFTPDVYNNGSEDMPIEEIQEGSDGSWTLLFSDDYFITLSGFVDDTMGWYSSASGDNFSCTKVEQ